MKFYLDTSIFGGIFDKEFKEATERLFSWIEEKQIGVIYSNVLEKELKSAPEAIKILANANFTNATYIEINEEMLGLAISYIEKGVLSPRSMNDAQHIAIATLAGASAIISWNFKHMANFIKIQQYNAINLQAGYRMISIHTPLEIIES
jgi:hypothetical protein